MHTEWTDQLSAYLDNELSPEGRVRVDAHLSECAECREVLQSLRALVSAAPAYQGTDPADQVWSGIAAGIDSSRSATLPVRHRHRHRFSLGQLAAAAATVAVLAGGGVWLAVRPGAAPATLAGSPAGDDAPVLVTAAAVLDDPDYDAAVQELEASLEAGRGLLDSTTIAVLEENLRIIDAAIAEARAAIEADRSNAFLGGRVKLHMQRKLILLRQAARAAGAAT